MRLRKKIFIVVIGFVLCSMFLLLNKHFVCSKIIEGKTKKSDIHVPTKEVREKWSRIEDILLEKKPETVREINSLLSELVKQENDTTVLLEQKASTQMGCISIVVAIVLAMLGFFVKGPPKFLSKRQRGLFLFFNVAIIVIFILSMYWSYQGFTVRENFASYNIDDLFEIMKDKDSNMRTFLISNILENEQIYAVNSKVNELKANALILALRFFIAGIIAFAIISLMLVFMSNGVLLGKTKEVIDNGKSEGC